MTAWPDRPLMSVEEYLELDRTSLDTRYEYIDGHVRMLAGGTLNHSTISVNLVSILRSLLRGGFCRVYNADARVRVSQTRYVYPDISVSCDEQDRGDVDIIQSPRVVIEVLSPGTEAYDRGRKLAYYRACPTIQEYVLVDTQRSVIEIFRRDKSTFWTYHVFEAGEDVELASLGIHFPLSAVYEDVVFPRGDDSQP